jgi:hypothetical protein
VVEAWATPGMTLIWSSGDDGVTSAPVTIDEVVVIGGAGGTIEALDQVSGEVRWTGPDQSFSGPLTSSAQGRVSRGPVLEPIDRVEAHCPLRRGREDLPPEPASASLAADLPRGEGG